MMHASKVKAKPKRFIILFKYPGLSKSWIVELCRTAEVATSDTPEMQKLNFPIYRQGLCEAVCHHLLSADVLKRMTSLLYTFVLQSDE